MNSLDNIYKNKKLIIFTCGYYGRLMFRKLYKKNNIIYFFDNFKKEKYFFNTRVIKPKFLDKKEFNYICIAGRDILVLKKQLLSLGFKNKQICTFNNSQVRPRGEESLEREKLAYTLLNKVLKSFKLNKIEYLCSYSGLLGIIREKKLSHFSDFEISCDLKDNKKILHSFKKNNFIIKYNKSFKYNKKIYKNFYVTSKKKFNRKIEYPRVAFVFLVKNSKGFCEVTSKKFQKSDYFSSAKTIKVKNLKFRVPLNFSKELVSLYGKNWKKKSKYWTRSNV